MPNLGTESDPDFEYHDGNAHEQRLGHICFAVPDLAAAVQRCDENQLTYLKCPKQCKMRDMAVVKDPGGIGPRSYSPTF